jgi:ketosteroid isomerase-like protein
MLKRVLLLSAIFIASTTSAFAADANGIVAAVGDQFDKAFTSCDVPAVLSLYEANAHVIFPGQGEVANNNEELTKVIKESCSGGAISDLKPVKISAEMLGDDYVADAGLWEGTMKSADGKSNKVQIRTTEVLHHSGGKWRYIIDHASIGTPPPPAK